MGHYSHTCKLSGVPITGGTPAVLFPLTPNLDRYDNSEASLAKEGTSYQCSNDGMSLKYHPTAFPIRGDYDDYGGMENIIEDDNTKVLEEYYGLTIDQIVGVLTRGFDVDEELKENPKFKELRRTSSMWIHRTVYEQLVAEPSGRYDDKLDLGYPALLRALGFVRDGDSTDSRYTMQFKYKDLVVNSDGTWINIPDYKYGVYSIKDLAKYAKKEKGIELQEGWEEIAAKDGVEQLYDYCFTEMESLYSMRDIRQMVYSDVKGELEKVLELVGLKKGASEDEINKATRRSALERFDTDSNRMNELAKFRLLNYDRYSMKNPLTELYFQKCKEGKLKSNVVEFWRFHHYLYATGTYFAPVGVAPQDGEHEAVYKVLSIAKDVLEPRIKEIEAYRKEEEAEEES